MLRKEGRLMLTLPSKPDPEPPAGGEVIGKGVPSSPGLCAVLLCAEHRGNRHMSSPKRSIRKLDLDGQQEGKEGSVLGRTC